MTPIGFFWLVYIVVGIMYFMWSYRVDGRTAWGISGFAILFVLLGILAWIGLGSPVSGNSGGGFRNTRYGRIGA